jgi:hypothetical protein
VFQEIGFGPIQHQVRSTSVEDTGSSRRVPRFLCRALAGRAPNGGYSGYRDATIIDYFDNGSFSGSGQSFQGENGRRLPVLGQWGFARLARDKFRLTVRFSNGQEWNGDFTIINRDRIHNIDENYDAVRVPR